MTIEIPIAILLFGALLVFLGFPLMKVGGASAGRVLHVRDDLMLKKNSSLALLKEIDLDYSLQKMSDEDYQVIRQSAINEGVELLQKIDNYASAEAWQQQLEEDLKKVMPKKVL